MPKPPPKTTGRKSIVQQRKSLFESGDVQGESKNRVVKRKRKHLRSLANMWQGEMVTTALKEQWGESASIGHSFYRDGVLAEYSNYHR
eukprot:UN06842